MDPQPPMPEAPAVPPCREPSMSLPARLLNVFATPGDVFEDLKFVRPSAANWLVPILIFGVLAAISVVLMMSQPAFLETMREARIKPIEQQVASGKITREQADQQIAILEKYSSPAVMKVGGAVAGFTMSFVSVFWWAFLLWLMARWIFKTRLDFMKVTEVAGLASMIGCLEILVRTLLIFGVNNPLASPSLALLLKNPDQNSPLFLMLSALNVMTFWLLAVRAIGLAKLTGATFLRAAIWVYVAWAIMTAVGQGFVALIQKGFGG